MTVIQCDRCKKLIEKGERVQFNHRSFDTISEMREWSSIKRADLDFCDNCYKELKNFLGVREDSK